MSKSDKKEYDVMEFVDLVGKKKKKKTRSKKAEYVFEKMGKKGPIKHFWETVSGAKTKKFDKLQGNLTSRMINDSQLLNSFRRNKVEALRKSKYNAASTLDDVIKKVENRFKTNYNRSHGLAIKQRNAKYIK